MIEKLAHVRERLVDHEAQQRVAVSLPRRKPFLNVAPHEGIDLMNHNIPGVSPYTITGTQHNESGRIVITGDPGKGYSDDPYQQFTPGAFTTPKPGSIGLESGTNYLNFQPQYSLDLSVARLIRFGGNRRMEFRVDAFKPSIRLRSPP